ncbi:MAG: hypothetical protein AAGC73_10600 [Verrucomicrobiota bacterium]
MAKKVTKKAAKKKAPAKKVAAKKAPTKKVAVKKAPAKKAAPVKKVAAKKAPVKKAPAKKAAKKAAKKKAPAKKILKTNIVARVDVGFGNSLYIRGEGAGLSWEKGAIMENISPYEWAFSTTAAKVPVTFKFLINDELWSSGEDLVVEAGGTSISTPSF